MDRVNQGSKDMLKVSLITSLVLVASLLIFGKYLISMFTTTQEIISLGVRQIRILAAGYVAMAITQVFGGIMRGAGDTMPSMWISMFTTVILQVSAWQCRIHAVQYRHVYENCQANQ
ncbi:MAG: MATE family efflux transporter [Clostridia bacterium]|nr:MATE family efflux transporter [Clostridia bacterium]